MPAPFKPIFLGVLAVLIWAAIPAFVKVGSTADSLPFLLVMRFLIASLFFLPSFGLILKKARQIPWSSWLLLTGVLGANFYFQGLAMIELPVSWYLVIFCLNPIFALTLLKIRFTRKVTLGIGGCLVGTLMFVNLNEISTTYSWFAFLYLVIGMLTWVLYTVLSKSFQAVLSSGEMTAVTQWSSFVAALVIWISMGSHMMSLDISAISSVIALGVFTPMAYYCFNACLRTHPKFSIVSQYLEPVFGIAIGFAFFGEHLGMLQLVGTALIVAGSTFIEP